MRRNVIFFILIIVSSLLPVRTSATPKHSPLSPADIQYLNAFNQNAHQFHLAMDDYTHLTGQSQFLKWTWRSDKVWTMKFASTLTMFHACDQAAKQLRPTARFRSSYALYRKAADEYDYNYRLLPSAMGRNDVAACMLCLRHMKSGEVYLKKSLALFNQATP